MVSPRRIFCRPAAARFYQRDLADHRRAYFRARSSPLNPPDQFSGASDAIKQACVAGAALVRIRRNDRQCTLSANHPTLGRFRGPELQFGVFRLDFASPVAAKSVVKAEILFTLASQGIARIIGRCLLDSLAGKSY